MNSPFKALFLAPQVCREDGEQRRRGPGDAGAEGVARRPAHPQHGEERGGVHVAARPQTSPGPGIEGPPTPQTPPLPPLAKVKRGNSALSRVHRFDFRGLGQFTWYLFTHVALLSAKLMDWSLNWKQ